MAEEDGAILKHLVSLGERQLARLAEELLSNEHVARAFAQALQHALEAKGRVDRNMQTILGILNLPSRGDVTRLTSKLEAIQGSLVNLNLKVDRLLSDRAHRPKQPRRAKAPPASGEPQA